jgi:hypothetical protein
MKFSILRVSRRLEGRVATIEQLANPDLENGDAVLTFYLPKEKVTAQILDSKRAPLNSTTTMQYRHPDLTEKRGVVWITCKS